MISLSIWGCVLAFALLAPAWAISRAARAVGSPRGRFSVGLALVLLFVALNVIFGIIGILLSALPPLLALAAGLALLVAQWGIYFFLMQYAFRLTRKQTFSPFGAYAALTLFQIGLAMFVVKPFLTEAFKIPARGMSPTLEPGDRFIVNKLQQPRRWDLVAYRTQGRNSAIYCQTSRRTSGRAAAI